MTKGVVMEVYIDKMIFRSAVIQDLPQLKAVYRSMIQDMNDNQIQIWDDVYPCEFFEDDIRDNRLYVLYDKKVLVSAFALYETNPGEESVEWIDKQGKALYIDRLGVNIDYARMGIGSFMLEKARETAGKAGAGYLRFFVVDVNEPAIRLYRKNSFIQADGVYDEVIDDDLILHEYGFEMVLSA